MKAKIDTAVFHARKSNKPVATAIVSYIAALLYIVLVVLVVLCFIGVKNANRGMIAGTACGTVGVVIGLFVVSKVFVWEIEPKIEQVSNGYKYSYKTPVGAGAGKDECSVHIYKTDKIKRSGYKTIIYGDLDVFDGIHRKKATQGIIYGLFEDDVYSLLESADFKRDTEYDDYSESALEAAEKAVKSKKTTSKY